jgi:hypothetical protein
MSEFKICKRCNIDKEIVSFTIKDKNTGRINNICKDCNRTYMKNYIKNNSEKIKEYRKENKEIISEKNKNYYFNNKEKFKILNKKYYLDNKFYINENHKNYYHLHKNDDDFKNKRIKYRLYNKFKINLKRKYRYNNDILYKINTIIRTNINRFFKKGSISKNNRTEIILGCSFEEFKLYIESKFEDWMTWENYGLYDGEFNHGWDLDHIIPISSTKTEDEIYKLNHYNLQPLCSKINRDIKKDKL